MNLKIGISILFKLLNIFLLFNLLFISCKSDHNKIEEATIVVEKFVNDLKSENYKSLKNTYPDFSKIGSYYKLEGFKISDKKIEKDTVKIFGKYLKDGQFEENILFVLIKDKNNNYFIEKTKGLSGLLNTDLCSFLKAKGCLSGLESDFEVYKVYEEAKTFFRLLIKEFKNTVEFNVVLDTQNITNSDGFISGNLIVNNNSEIDIPAYSYNLNLIIQDNNTKGIYQHKINNERLIPANRSECVKVVFAAKKGTSKYDFEFKIENDSFLISNLIISELDWNCEKIDTTLNDETNF